MAWAVTDWTNVVRRAANDGDSVAFAEFAQFVSSLLAHWKAFEFSSDWGDIIGVVFEGVRKLEAEGRIPNSAACAGLIHTIAWRSLSNEHRKRKRRAEVALEVGATELAAPGETPEQLFAGAEARFQLEEAIRALPADLKAVVTSVYFEGKTLQMTSKELALSMSTVKRRLAAALRRLRETFGVRTEIEPVS